MNPQKYLKALSILTLSLLAFSCSKDEPSPAKSRDIRFEVTGNFVGTLSVTYINASGRGANETIPSLPWNRDIIYASSVPSTALTVGGSGGSVGKTIRIKVFAGGSLKSERAGVADNSGMVVVASPSHIF